ncbi:MAG: Uncharacterised protein [Synechococcus sp. CC9902]|nr:MAG: Uncharacterised protein [Synechococcus sp. CC9902]
MNLVVTRKQMTVTVNQFGPVEGPGTIPDGYREPSTQQNNLVATGHRHQKATALFRKRRCQCKFLTVIAHEGEVFRQTNQLSPTTGSQIDLLLGGIEVQLGVLAAGELNSSGQKISHMKNPLSPILEAIRRSAELRAPAESERHPVDPNRHSRGSRRRGSRA